MVKNKVPETPEIPEEDTPTIDEWPWNEPVIDVDVDREVDDSRVTGDDVRSKVIDLATDVRSLGVEPLRDVVRGYARRGLDKFDDFLAGAAGKKKDEPKD
jgi:hypothetical protein